MGLSLGNIGDKNDDYSYGHCAIWDDANSTGKNNLNEATIKLPSSAARNEKPLPAAGVGGRRRVPEAAGPKLQLFFREIDVRHAQHKAEA